MNKTVGHRYRMGVTLAMWVALIYLFIITPSNRYLVGSRYTRTVLLSGLLLTLSFTLLTFAFWVLDRKRGGKE